MGSTIQLIQLYELISSHEMICVHGIKEIEDKLHAQDVLSIQA